MLFNFQGMECKLFFKRVKDVKKSSFQYKPNFKVTVEKTIYTTFVYVEDLKDKKIILQGKSVCSLDDNFVKEIGRKQAIKDLVICNNLNKEESSVIWKTYVSRKK